MVRPAKDDFNTPLRAYNTRSRTPIEPSAPIKVRDPLEHVEYTTLINKNTTGNVKLIKRLDEEDASHATKPETIIEKLREFLETYRITSFNNDKRIKDEKIFQVEHMSPDQVLSEIARVKAQGRVNGFKYPLQSRAPSNQYFSTDLDSWVLRAGNTFDRSRGGNEDSTNQDNITTALLDLVFTMCYKEKGMTLREIYYTNTELYQDPSVVGEAANDLCCMIGCTRSSLGITATEKGIFHGDIAFKVGERKYDGLDSDETGITIPLNIGDISDISSEEALFILVVEKDTVFRRLVQDGFCEQYKCIIVTAKGMPDVTTRAFLSLIRRKLKLPVFALMDCNPHGLKIYGVYRYGSKAMSYDRENLTTPGIEFLGVRYPDIEKYGIPEKSLEDMTDPDMTTAEELLNLDHMKEFHGDLESMRNHKRKMQIEAFHAYDIEYLAKVVLPRMLYERLCQLLHA